MIESLEKELKSYSIESLFSLYNNLTTSRKKLYGSKIKYEKNFLVENPLTSVQSLKRWVTNLSKKKKDVIKSNVNEFMLYYDLVSSVLDSKIDEIKNSNENSLLNELKNKCTSYLSIIKLIGNDDDLFERLGLQTYLYEIKTSNNPDVINDSLEYIINTLTKMGLFITEKDFNYILYVNNYMNEFFKYIDEDKNDLKKILKTYLNQYPLFNSYLYLSMINVLNKKRSILIKIINKNINNKLENVQSSVDNINSLYFKTCKQYNNLSASDEITIIDYFKKNKKLLPLYKEDNKEINKIISSISNLSTYKKYTDSEKNFYKNNLIELYWDLDEYKFVLDNLTLFNYANNISKEKFNKGNFKKLIKAIELMDKRIKATNKDLDNEMKKLNKVLVMESDKFYKMQISCRNISKRLDELVIEMIDLLKTYDIEKFSKDIHLNINEKSSIHDVLKIINNNYNVLRSLNIPNIDYIYEMEYFHHLSLLDNVYFNHINSIKYLIEQKYNLYNIKVSVPDINSKEFGELKNNISILIRYLNILEHKLSVDDIKIILDKKD